MLASNPHCPPFGAVEIDPNPIPIESHVLPKRELNLPVGKNAPSSGPIQKWCDADVPDDEPDGAVMVAGADTGAPTSG
jgi:hypothetical protein